MDKPIKALVVDDSLFMRTLISDLLGSDPQIKVAGTAKNGKEALEKLAEIKPDVITLDIVMPGWNGLTTLKHIMADHPTPVVILSAHSRENADITMKCLEEGAVGYVLKPSGELSLDIGTVKTQLLEEVKAASQVRRSSLVARRSKGSKLRVTSHKPRVTSHERRIIVMGASTGGHQTLSVILSALPTDFPVPVVVVQHAPNDYFSQSMVENFNERCEISIKVAENAEVVQPGVVYFVPAGFNSSCVVRRAQGTKHIEEIIFNLEKEESNSIRNLTPSIDAIMQSVAKAYGENVIGVILTGMGCDGHEGMKAIKEAGGVTIAQDESALIFGMPRVVIEAGLADVILPADAIAGALMKLVTQIDADKKADPRR